MIPRLVWSPIAREDLQSIWDYYAEQADFELADRVVDRISARTESLVEYSELGQSCEELLPGLRMLVVPPHVIFYRARGACIEVLHVLHGKQDREQALGKE